MPIVVACDCGKQFRARDEDAGKRGRCPGCGQPVLIPSGDATAGRAAHPMASKRKWAGSDKPTPGLSIGLSTGAWVMIGFAVLVPAFVIFLKLGPIKARDDWNRISDQASTDITDVMLRVLQAEAGPRPAHQPNVRSVAFMEIGISMSVPDIVGFTGMTTAGSFKGLYHTHTGEVEADYEGAKVTGRVKNHVVQAELNGKTVKLPPRLPRDD